MNLTTITIVSVDGVMQGLGAPDEDRSGGFERGGWATPLFDQHSDRLLLVRAACVAEGGLALGSMSLGTVSRLS
jgi:hypothetical protein